MGTGGSRSKLLLPVEALAACEKTARLGLRLIKLQYDTNDSNGADIHHTLPDYRRPAHGFNHPCSIPCL